MNLSECKVNARLERRSCESCQRERSDWCCGALSYLGVRFTAPLRQLHQRGFFGTPRGLGLASPAFHINKWPPADTTLPGGQRLRGALSAITDGESRIALRGCAACWEAGRSSLRYRWRSRWPDTGAPR